MECIGAFSIVFAILYTANPVIIGATVAIVYIFAKTVANPAATFAIAYYKSKYDAAFDIQTILPIIALQCIGAFAAVEVYKYIGKDNS